MDPDEGESVMTDPSIPGRPGRRPGSLAMIGVACVIASLFVPLRLKFENSWEEGAWNLLHLPGFFLLTHFLVRIFRGRILLSAGLAFAAGAITEWLQARVGRSASFQDLMLDGFGILLAVAWARRPGRWPASRVLSSSLVLVGGIGFAFTPALTGAFAAWKARTHLPVLVPLGEATAARLWKPQGRTVMEVADGTGALRVRIKPGAFGGLNFRPGSQDWSTYSELILTLSNPGAPLRLGLRIDDARSAADRVWFSDETTLGRGLSEVRIPLRGGTAPDGEARIDLSRIARLVLFVDKTEIPVEFSLQSAVLR